MKNKINEIDSEIKNLLKQLVVYDAQIAEIDKKRQTIFEALLDLSCPFYIGQVTECCGMVHRGKKMRVTKRVMDHSGHGNYFWRVFGLILRQDGSETNSIGEFTSGDWYFAEESKHKKRMSDEK